jgi:hypothetical protein
VGARHHRQLETLWQCKPFRGVCTGVWCSLLYCQHSCRDLHKCSQYYGQVLDVDLSVFTVPDRKKFPAEDSACPDSNAATCELDYCPDIIEVARKIPILFSDPSPGAPRPLCDSAPPNNLVNKLTQSTQLYRNNNTCAMHRLCQLVRMRFACVSRSPLLPPRRALPDG